MSCPRRIEHTYTKGFLETQVAVLMGGRVAEELFMNHMTSGASNDIERATEIAQHMVCEWGMSELGPLAYRKPGNAFEADRAHGISEATAQRVDEEIRRVIMTGYDRARGLIEDNRDAVRLLAEELLKVESLEADEIRAILDQAARLALRAPAQSRRSASRGGGPVCALRASAHNTGRMPPAPEPVRLERLPRFAWAIIAIVALSVLYRHPGGARAAVSLACWHGRNLAGDPTAHLPLKARPPTS